MNLKAGETFTIYVNQGERDAVIVAVLGDRYLYEYEMPNGSTCLRNEKDRPVSYRAISDKWLDAIEEQYGVQNLQCRPQQSQRGAAFDRLLERLKS